MPVFEDPYKSEGSVEFKIEKLSQMARTKLLIRRRRYSQTIYVRGIPWKIIAAVFEKQNDQETGQFFDYILKCGSQDRDPEWTCKCTASMKILAQKEGKEDRTGTIDHVFNAMSLSKSVEKIPLDELMDPVNGWYDEWTDSIIIHAHIAADAPHGVTNMPNDVYTEYTMRSEHALFVEFKGQYRKSNLTIEDKIWSLTYLIHDKTLQLEMATHESDSSETIAECVFWYWEAKDSAIFWKVVHTFIGEESSGANLQMKLDKLTLQTNGTPVNNKFNVVIRLLDKRIACENNRSDSNNWDCEGIDTVKLNICGRIKEATFEVPKYGLIWASPVFQAMFVHEMTEKTTGIVENIKETNPEEFGQFLKAILPKQEHPNPSNVFALLKLADRYQCQLLRDRCELHLMNCVEIPLVHRLTCANFYELNKLKNSLMVSLDGTGMFKLLQQTEPYLGILNELTKMIERI